MTNTSANRKQSPQQLLTGHQSKSKQQTAAAQPKQTHVKAFRRPMIDEATKCQVTLHQNINNALKKGKKADKVMVVEDSTLKARVNRADLRNLRGYKTFKDRVQSLHVPRLLSQMQDGTFRPHLHQVLNDEAQINAYAVLNFQRDTIPGCLNGRKLHTS